MITVTSGAAATNGIFVTAMDGTYWTITISNAGIVTITSTGVLLTPADIVGGLVDSNSITWLLVVDFYGFLTITTETLFENKQYYPAIMIVFTTSVGTEQFELHAVKPNTVLHRR